MKRYYLFERALIEYEASKIFLFDSMRGPFSYRKYSRLVSPACGILPTSRPFSTDLPLFFFRDKIPFRRFLVVRSKLESWLGNYSSWMNGSRAFIGTPFCKDGRRKVQFGCAQICTWDGHGFDRLIDIGVY